MNADALALVAQATEGRVGLDGQGTGTCPTCDKRDKFRFSVGDAGLVVFACHSGTCKVRDQDPQWLEQTARTLVARGVPQNVLLALAGHQPPCAGLRPGAAAPVADPGPAPGLPPPEALDAAHDRLLRSPDLLALLRDRMGLRLEHVVEAELGFDAASGRFWLPVFNDAEDLLTIIRRDFRPDARLKSLIWKGSQDSYLYAPFGVRPDAPVIVTAGERDCLALCARGFNAVSFTNGESAAPPPARITALRGHQLVFAYDNDAGNHATRVASALLPHVDAASIVEWPFEVPDKYDVCDILSDPTLGQEVIEKAVADAKPWTASDGHALEQSAEVEKALRALRVRERAGDIHRAEKADASFRQPPSDWTLAEMLTRPRVPQEYTIDRLHPSGSSSLIAAQYKVGKTTLMLNVAKAYADGEPFLGEFKVNPGGGRIALFNYELTEDMLLDQYLIPLGIGNLDGLAVLNLRGHNFDLRSPTAFSWAAQWLRDRDCDALILDPFGAAARLQNENDNSEARNWLLGTLDPFKEAAGIRDLWMPAHTGRGQADEGEEHVRGASAVDDWADVRWLYTKARVNDENGPTWRRYLSAGGRAVDVSERELAFEPEDHLLYVSQYRNRTQARVSGGVEAVVRAVEKQPGIKSQELRNSLPVGNRDKAAAISEALRQELIHVKPGARNAKHYYPGPEGLDA